jgi:hypothetical protein
MAKEKPNLLPRESSAGRSIHLAKNRPNKHKIVLPRTYLILILVCIVTLGIGTFGLGRLLSVW